ncbi:MAG: SCO6745 family protein [Acidimicrobiales bacterium]
MTPAELVAEAHPKIGALGAAFYFAPATLAKGKELGLDGMRFYFLGRGGVLGDCEPSVVGCAFGYFAPGAVAKLWTSGREIIDPREAGRVYTECARDFGRATFGSLDGLDKYCAAAETIVEAADAASLPLFAGLAAEPLSDDVPGRAMQLTAVLREFRGSAHLAAVRSLNLDPAVAHAIKRPEMVESFGYPEPPSITDADRALLDEAEIRTDAMVLPAFSALDAGGADALVAGLDAMTAAIDG